MVISAVASANYSECRGISNWWPMMVNERIFMALLWIMFLILLLILVYGLVKRKRANFLDWTAGDTPLDILKRRYAKGEITKEEFDRIKSDLT
jgi:putative membrane protein